MYTRPALELVFRVLREPGFEEHIDTVQLGACAQERKVEKVAIERGHYGRFNLLDVLKEALDDG
jgi:hypothetical protein